MQWYYDRIKDKSSELEKYPGYLPSIVKMKSIQKDIFQ